MVDDSIPQSGSPLLRRLNLFGWALAITWTVVIGGSLIWSLRLHEFELVEIAKATARAHFEKDLLYRVWNSNYGGVYAPLDEGESPSPYVPSNHSDRELVTESGRVFTIISPAMMTRQVHDLGRRFATNTGRIISLNPLNPENAPDPWEERALRRLEAGEFEVSSVEMVEGKENLRLMRSLVTSENCLPCHAQQGYEVGQIRGGITQNILMAPLRLATARSDTMITLGHGFLWVLGIMGIGFGRQRLAVQVQNRERAEARIRHLANHDELTSLPNRNLFFDRLKRSIARSDRSGLQTALLFIDLDGFKPINDSLGHEAGDRVLSEIARRLLTCVRETDTAARVGGDEFAIILSDLSKPDVAARVANYMLEVISQPLRLPQDEVAVGAGIGIAFFPDDAGASEDLLHAADSAMYEVKNLGKNGFSFASGPIRTVIPQDQGRAKRKANASR